ncbi:hypothetical protein D047_1445B, partial [Vibrio parahaemolyticus VPTS-2010_2]
TLHSHLR